jgi:hypothetical protein
MAATPLVLLIDMDGTIIGDASPLACMHELQANINARQNSLETYPFRQSLIRPHVKSFLKFARHEYDCECFIYTAADENWAAKVINCVEKEIGLKFNRPILSRKDCVLVNNVYRKNISHVSSRIRSVLKRRQKFLIDSNIVLIDNNDVIFPNGDYRQIICPTYDARIGMDVLKNINITEIHANTSALAKILFKYGYIIKSSYKSIDELLSSYYLSVARSLHESCKESDKISKDTFWLDLKTAFRSLQITSFDKETLSHIRKVLKGT